jgi:hypothetical protein
MKIITKKSLTKVGNSPINQIKKRYEAREKRENSLFYIIHS